MDNYINLINNGKKDVIESLYELTNQEIEFKDSKEITTLVQVAGFPFLKKFKDFDFSFQPSINKEKMLKIIASIISFSKNYIFILTLTIWALT